MCLAVPAKIVKLEDTLATLDMDGNTTQADVSLVPEVEVGDYVIVHAGLAIQKYDEQEALETLQLLRDLAKSHEGGEE